MDIRDCIDILKERRGCGCEGHTRGFLNELPPVPDPISEHIRVQSTLDLMNLIMSLQEERVQTYALFDEILHILIAEERLGEYPMLCMEVTSRFSAISKTIKEIAAEFRRRELTVLISSVDTIQLNEKEKLLIYAAKHMDEIQKGSPTLHAQLATTPQVEYNCSALQRLELLISDALSAIQCEKCDLMEIDAEK